MKLVGNLTEAWLKFTEERPFAPLLENLVSSEVLGKVIAEDTKSRQRAKKGLENIMRTNQAPNRKMRRRFRKLGQTQQAKLASTHAGRVPGESYSGKKVAKESTENVISNLDLTTPKGRERANYLRRREKAQKLDKAKPIKRASQNVASDEDASKAAEGHGDTVREGSGGQARLGRKIKALDKKISGTTKDKWSEDPKVRSAAYDKSDELQKTSTSASQRLGRKKAEGENRPLQRRVQALNNSNDSNSKPPSEQEIETRKKLEKYRASLTPSGKAHFDAMHGLSKRGKLDTGPGNRSKVS
jgi:hypothetical protein